ncbi:hypothetical protein [Candidatus Arsenophonus triatominarum]|uniref:hypothetical protein n=1 Tax=Candidatus Arsenophonus triatominarum TaxID=57911 RepID=UPI0007C59735|nr:hypothetical protein [Candidatus Arsenophonus triatominarum]
MSISVQSNLNPYSLFTREIGDKYIQQAVNSSSKEDATHLDIFTKIKDWFCGTKTDEVLGLLYDLTHTPDNQSDIESSLQKAEAFYKLKEMSPAKHQDKFQASIIKNEASSDYTFKFSIKGAMEERAFSYGDINVKDNRDFFGEKNYKTHFNERLGNFCNKGNPDNTWIYNFFDSHQEIKESMRKSAERSYTESFEVTPVKVATKFYLKKYKQSVSSIILTPEKA